MTQAGQTEVGVAVAESNSEVVVLSHERFCHYIRYADGSEELYDHQKDPHEWPNLAGRAEHAALIAEMQSALPKQNADPVIGPWKNWEIEAWLAAERLND